MLSTNEKDDYLSTLINDPENELIDNGMAIAYEMERDRLVKITQTAMGVRVDYTDKGKEFFKSGGFDKLKKADFINENKKLAREVVVILKESHHSGIEMILNFVNCFHIKFFKVRGRVKPPFFNAKIGNHLWITDFRLPSPSGGCTLIRKYLLMKTESVFTVQ
jgi:hypothetical protein